MKIKQLKHIGFLLFILLSFISCVNEMDMIEDEQKLEVLSSEIYPPTRPNYEEWVKNLIDYGRPNPQEKLNYKILEDALSMIYLYFPEIRGLIDVVINKGIKFQLAMGGVNGKNSWFNPETSEIGFWPDHFKLGNILHELLHFISFNTIPAYHDGHWAAREEYEIRVLTDLFMRRCKYGSYEYQGMQVDHEDYGRYLEWLDKLIENEVNLFQFKADFFEFGFSRMWAIEKEGKDTRITVRDLVGYEPLLFYFWFSGKM